MGTQSEEMAKAAKAADAAQRAARLAQSLLELGKIGQAKAMVEISERKSSATHRHLVAAGVVPGVSTNYGAMRRRAPEEHAALDTPDAYALLNGLRALLPLAERLDKARGDWYEDAPVTDSKGTNYAESVHLLASWLDLEVNGPWERSNAVNSHPADGRFVEEHLSNADAETMLHDHAALEAEAILRVLGEQLQWEQTNLNEWMAEQGQTRYFVIIEDSGQAVAFRDRPTGIYRTYAGTSHPMVGTLSDAKAACERHHATGKWE